MTAHEDLERRLLRSVAARAPERRGRWRRRVALLVVPLALAGGGAGATALVGPDGVEKAARRLEVRALRETARDPSCRYADALRRGVLVEGFVPSEVSRVLPALRRPGRRTPAGADEVAARVGGFRILRASLLVGRFDGGLRLAAGVTEGAGLGRFVDPAACLAARQAVVRRVRPDAEDAVRVAALERQRRADDVRPGARTFWVWQYGDRGSGGSGITIRAGRPIPTGLLGSGSGGYVGIARSEATAIDVRSRRTGRRLARVAPQDGLFAFRLPRGTGPLSLRQLAADGRVVARQRLR